MRLRYLCGLLQDFQNPDHFLIFDYLGSTVFDGVDAQIIIIAVAFQRDQPSQICCFPGDE